MSKRFQAKTNALTQQRLEAVREALSLEESEKAVLLDEVAQIAFWVVRQAMEGRTIQAIAEDEPSPQVLEHAALSALVTPVRLELTREEARNLVKLLSAPEPASPPLRKTLEALRSLDEPFEVDVEDPAR